MVGVGIGVQEVDDQAFAALIAQVQDGSADGVFVQSRQHPAPCVHTLGHFQPQVARDDRGKLAVHAVSLRARAAAKLQHVAKALGGDQPGLRQQPFKDGIRGGRRAMHDQVDCGQVGPGGVKGVQHAARLVRQRGRNLGQPDGPAGGIKDHNVGKGAAHIDARHQPGHARNLVAGHRFL